MLIDTLRTPAETGIRSSRRRAGSWLIAGILALLLLYWSLRGIEWGRVWLSVDNVRWGFVLGGTSMTVLGFFLRSVRWRILLNLEDPSLGVATAFWATMCGYLGNNFLPARGGDLMRVLLIHRCSTLSKTYIVTTALAERIVEMRRDVFPGGIGFVQFVHGGGLLFPGAAPHVGADGLRGDVLRGAMQPTGEHRAIRELGGVLREREEHALRHIFSEMRIANHAQRGGIDEIHVAAHQLGKRRFGAAFSVSAQQLRVGLVVHSPNSSRCPPNRTGTMKRRSLLPRF